MQKTKLKELLSFPCQFTYKVLGLAQPQLIDQVHEVVLRYTLEEYHSQVKVSSKGNYYSISITINAININQVETLYKALSELEIVRIVL